ncbi:hypothetical protein CMK11_00595 [Candidatus Poribacteria bacterium]|nr:hypothetical protein [Candidatus Poribacteria bacterium]
MREKIVLIGAGSASFTQGLVADLLQRDMEADVALVDVDPAALEVAERLTSKMISARRPEIGLTASVDRRDVLPGATAVICTVGVGGRRAWEQDVLIPRKHGIFQPVGDTVGPGGTSRAMRMIPAMVGVAEDVVDLAPDALFFNYGNPMSPVCRAIRKATGAEVVGLCHGVFGVAQYLAEVLGAERDDLDYTAIGINHLTWFVEARADGRDLMPRLVEIAEEKLKGVPLDELRDPFTWELTRLFGAFPAVLDRHVTEFFPRNLGEGTYYGKTLGTDVYSFEGTISGGDRTYARMTEQAHSPDPLGDDHFARFSGEHERVLEIIHCLRNSVTRVFHANLPNTGQVANLPADAVIESPAVADGGQLRALAQKPLPVGIAGTLATRFLWVETVVEAALEGSRDKFIQALLLDGAVDSVGTATALADELIEAQSAYLPWVG